MPVKVKNGKKTLKNGKKRPQGKEFFIAFIKLHDLRRTAQIAALYKHLNPLNVQKKKALSELQEN